MGKEIGRESALFVTMFLIVMVLGALTVMNMLVGVLCEVVSAVAATEEEQAAVSFIKARVRFLLQDSGLDQNNDGLISKEEFEKLIEHPEASVALQEVGVDVIALVDCAEFIFQSDDRGQKFEKKLGFDDFMDIVLKLRGGNMATVRDIVDLRKFVHSRNTGRNNQLARMEERQKYTEEKLHGLNSKIDHLCNSISHLVTHIDARTESPRCAIRNAKTA